MFGNASAIPVHRLGVVLIQLPPPKLEEPSVHLARFEHVPGCKVCHGLYQHYTLPDGRSMHYYHKDNLNELVLDTMVQPPSYPLSVQSLGLPNGLPPPPSAVRPVAIDMPDPYVPAAPLSAPKPAKVSLPEEDRLEFIVRFNAVHFSRFVGVWF